MSIPVKTLGTRPARAGIIRATGYHEKTWAVDPGAVLEVMSQPIPLEDRRDHVYTLHYYGTTPDEEVRAAGSTEAVKARETKALPAGITDQTAIADWIRRRQATREGGLTDLG